MKRALAVTAGGALSGVLLGVIGMAMSAGLIIDGAAGFTIVDPVAGSGRATITAGTDAVFLYVLTLGVLGGGLIAYLTAAWARSWRPTEARFGPGVISVAGAVVGAIAAYAVVRAGLGIGGVIVNEVITVSAFRGIIIFVVAGGVAGAVVAVVAEKYSRQESLGLEGDAWPRTAASFMTESLPAMLIPALALLLIAGTVVGVAQVLLAGGTVGAIIVASIIAVGVLGGATYLTSHGGPPTNN